MNTYYARFQAFVNVQFSSPFYVLNASWVGVCLPVFWEKYGSHLHGSNSAEEFYG